MKVKALKTFNSKPYGFITAGSIFNCEPRYARDLAKNKLIVILEEGAPGPNDNKAVASAPARKAATEPAPDDGAEQPQSSLEAALASRGLTSRSFASGAKRTNRTRDT